MAWRSALGIPYLEADHVRHGGAWLGKISGTKRSQLGRRLRALPLSLEVETSSGVVGLVHGNCPFDDWQEMQRVPWSRIEATSSIAECCLWSRERYVRQYPNPIRNVRAVVHGHMAVRYVKVLGNVHYIDTGGWQQGGYFSFLELETLRSWGGPVNPKSTGRNG
jgi:serine/threonine protein phosphatase 1